MSTSHEPSNEPRRLGPEGPAEELLIAEEVAALLRVKTTWVYAETRAHRIPHMRLGRYCRYRRSAIELWLDERERDEGSGT
ncbi:MAG: DNA-binding protein [Conexibacter sp.]|nr:DNA-binding protein [Conexibacter sp.]